MKNLVLKSLLFGILTFGGVVFSDDICAHKLVKKTIRDFAPKTSNNKSLLKAIKCENNELILDYLIDNPKIEVFSEEQNQETHNFMQDALIDMYCNKNGSIYMFRQNGIPMTYNYKENDKNIFSIKLNEKTCQEN